ncbi:glycosyltransferase family 9 protein [Aquirufa sp. ROCK-SH2]
MAHYYFKKSLWEYKFKKLSHLILALKYYAQIYFSIVRCKLIYPKSKVIGVLLAEHFGDIVAAEPIIPELLRKYPEAKIFWIIKPNFKAVLENHPLIHEIIEEKNLLTSIYLSRYNPFHFFYNLHLNQLREDEYYHLPLKNERAYELNLTINNYYESNNLLSVFSQLADLGRISGYPNIYLNKKSVQLPFEKYWVINHQSNDVEREWSSEKWVQIISRAIKEWDVNIIEIGLNNSLNFSHPKFKSMVGKTTLEESMKIIQKSCFFLGVDTGPTHCANAFKIPALILCGDFKNFRNYKSYSGAYQLDGIANIYFNTKGPASELSVEEVWEQLSTIYLKQQDLELSTNHNL